MNKTININLAGLFFHIDENAYAKLQRYLDAIRRSFSDPQGRDEIIQDIEARIAELFSERVKNERQVIGLKEVDEVISIMGQPEDYRLDEEIFDDEPKSTIHRTPHTAKKLYRDTDISYIGGVCSGLGHYLGIDAIWLRIIFIILTFITGGGFILVYIVFWIFVPEALTTTEKLEMRGKPVNIDNIQRKVKEGFENVTDSVKNADYEKYGNQAKKGAGSFFNTLGKILMFLLTVFVKFIAILLIITGGAVVISLFIGLFTAGTIGILDGGFGDYVDLVNITGAPIWLISLFTFFAVGIPFFALFYLGLKILVNNLKSMSTTAKLTLLGLWLVSIIALSVLGIRQATAVSVQGDITTSEVLNMQSQDTLVVKMVGNKKYGNNLYRSGSWKLEYNDQGNRVLYNRDVRLIVKSSDDGQNKLEINKSSQGRDYEEARFKAKNIDYGYNFSGNVLQLDGYFLTGIDNKYRDQEIEITLFLVDGTTLMADKNTSSYHRNTSRHGNQLKNGYEGRYVIMQNGELICNDCPEESNSNDDWQYREYEDDDNGGEYDYDEAAKQEKDALDLELEDKTDTLRTQIDTTRI